MDPILLMSIEMFCALFCNEKMVQSIRQMMCVLMKIQNLWVSGLGNEANSYSNSNGL